MDLLQVIIPEPTYFFILLPDDEEIRVDYYSKIDINFCNRVVFKDGKRIDVRSPLITYRVVLDDISKGQLRKLFVNANTSNMCTIQTRRARIMVGKDQYIFNVDISAIPDMGTYFSLDDIQNSVEINLKLEDTTISLFDRAEEAYEKYRRFEILDL